MNAPANIGPDLLAKLREPFPDHQISKLPKETKKQAEERKAGNNIVWKCEVCGGMHHKNAVHLDYVGHAALTYRLLETDPFWNWEPMGLNPDGTPALDRNGGLWIKLTVCGITRPGYGCADGKSGGDAVKEIIGDALRNAAMRFGAALDLWHKGDLHVEDVGDAGDEAGNGAVGSGTSNVTVEGEKHDARRNPWSQFYSGRSALHKGLVAHEAELTRLGLEGTLDDLENYLTSPEYADFVKVAGEHMPHYLEGGPPAPPEFRGIFAVEQKARDMIVIRGNVPADLENA